MWVPPYDFWDYTKSTFFSDEPGVSDMWRRYFVCAYYMVLVIGGNELGPQTDAQYIYIVTVNLTGAIVNAIIFGELAVLIAQLLRRGADYQA